MMLKDGILLSCMLFLYARGTVYKISSLVISDIIKRKKIDVSDDEVSQSIKEMQKRKWLISLF